MKQNVHHSHKKSGFKAAFHLEGRVIKQTLI